MNAKELRTWLKGNQDVKFLAPNGKVLDVGGWALASSLAKPPASVPKDQFLILLGEPMPDVGPDKEFSHVDQNGYKVKPEPNVKGYEGH